MNESKELHETIREIVRIIVYDIKKSEVDLEEPIYEILGSLEYVDLIASIENKLHIEFPDEYLFNDSFHKFEDMVDYICNMQIDERE